MGIRETLNENPRVTTVLTICIIVAVLGFLGWQIWGGSSVGQSEGGIPTKKFFSIDDGQTWFADDIKKVAPFDHKGKPAYEAFVYKCDGKTFVNHLLRYTPEGKKRLEAMLNNPGPGDIGGIEFIQGESEVKSPGQKDWVKGNDMRSAEVRKPKCSKIEDLEIVRP